MPQEVKDKISKLGINKNGIEISQYSLRGAYIKDYITVSEATRMTGVDTSDIVKCCKGKKRSAGGYQWRYKSDGIESLENIEKKKILQYDKNDFLVKEWNSQMDAARYFNVTPEAICACLNGRSKTCKGYIWKYSD